MDSERFETDDLTLRIVGPEDTPEAIVILCHGFGAPGTDLVPLAGEFCRCRPELNGRVQFVFPEAPLTIPEVPGGRAWWPIDMIELQMAIMQGSFREMRQTIPPMLPAARGCIEGLLERLQKQSGLPMSKFVLGGFSQGAMLTTDVTLRLNAAPGGLIIYSGTLLAEPEWRELAPRRAGLSVLQTHGTSDPILPYDAALWLRDLLTGAGLQVDFRSFHGPHTISADGVQSGADLVAAVLEDAS